MGCYGLAAFAAIGLSYLIRYGSFNERRSATIYVVYLERDDANASGASAIARRQ